MLGQISACSSSDSIPARPPASPPTSGSKRPEEARQLNDSLYELHKPDGTPSMQIVFFHGLYLGDSTDAHLDTWESGDSSVIWPGTWLVEEFADAHIFTVSYSRGVGRSALGSSDMYIITENLLADLLQVNIGQIPYCPVVLVGHSFGGLVIKRLCLDATKSTRNGEKAKAFVENLGGIFFYSTPHHGSPVIQKLAGRLRSPVLKYFEILSTETERLNFEFDHLSANWQIRGLGEGLPTQLGFFKDMVVVPEAASRGGGLFNIVGNADHISICKPQGKIDRRFYALTDLLRSLKEDARIRKETSMQEDLPQNILILPRQIIARDALVEETVSKLESVKVLGLAGMGGVGKTTLAMAMFNKLAPRFEYTCFVRDVKLITGGIDNVENVLWDCLHVHGKKVEGPKNMSSLRGRQLLLVLDDISLRDCKVVPNLARTTAEGSRFIVTSREHDLIRDSAEDFSGEVLVVPFLNGSDAKVLFMKYAFPGLAAPPLEVNSLLEDIVKKCDGLPLTLEVLGKYLKGKQEEEVWEQALGALNKAGIIKNLNERLWAKLMLSYKCLSKEEQRVFLDVTNFFWGNDNWTLREAKAAWTIAYRAGGELLWQTLVNMSLVYDVNDDQVIRMHEQLHSLGKLIASEPSSKGSYQVWKQGSSGHVSGSTIGSDQQAWAGTPELRILETIDESNEKDIHALRLNATGAGEVMHIPSNAFRKLKKLRYLEANCPVIIDEAEEAVSLPTELVLLKCEGQVLFNGSLQTCLAVLKVSSLEYHPSSVEQHAAISHSSIDTSSGRHALSFANLPSLRYLKIIDTDLQTLPESFGQLKALQRLACKNCKFQSLPESFGQLCRLKTLIFDHCTELSTLPESFGRLSALIDLECRGGCGLRSLPGSFGQLSSLKRLFLFEYDMTSLPESFGHLSKLETLELLECSIDSLPDSFPKLSSLTHLSIMKCRKLNCLPESFGQLSSLKRLQLQGCSNLRQVPDSFAQLTKLQCLWITLPMGRLLHMLGPNFVDLRHLYMHLDSNDSIPECIKSLPSLRIIELTRRRSLRDPWPSWLNTTNSNNHRVVRPILEVFRAQDGGFSLIEEYSSLRQIWMPQSGFGPSTIGRDDRVLYSPDL